jgi:hypothetical protein
VLLMLVEGGVLLLGQRVVQLMLVE